MGCLQSGWGLRPNHRLTRVDHIISTSVVFQRHDRWDSKDLGGFVRYLLVMKKFPSTRESDCYTEHTEAWPNIWPSCWLMQAHANYLTERSMLKLHENARSTTEASPIVFCTTVFEVSCKINAREASTVVIITMIGLYLCSYHIFLKQKFWVEKR